MPGQAGKIKFGSFQITLAVIMLAFGIMITAQIRTQVKVTSSLENQTSQDLSVIIINLNEKRSELERNLAGLQSELANIESKADAGVSLSATLNNQIKQLSIFTGGAATEGVGITVTITGDSPLFYMDLIDLANELFGSGAEVVAINDTRINFNSMIFEGKNVKGDTVITIDGKELFFPIVIKAIGNADTLEKGLTYPGGRIDFFNNFYHIYPTIKKEQLVSIPTSRERNNRYIQYPVSEGG